MLDLEENQGQPKGATGGQATEFWRNLALYRLDFQESKALEEYNVISMQSPWYKLTNHILGAIHERGGWGRYSWRNNLYYLMAITCSKEISCSITKVKLHFAWGVSSIFFHIFSLGGIKCSQVPALFKVQDFGCCWERELLGKRSWLGEAGQNIWVKKHNRKP